MLKWRIGDVTITKIVELEMTGGTRFILPDASREACLPIAWLSPHFMDDEGRLKMSVHALAIETPSRRIIVDTCLGNEKQGRSVPGWNQRQGPFLRDLAAAGFAPDSVDTVLCTHLHIDHVGWNTTLVDGKWQPTFPDARYLMGEIEFAYWRDQKQIAEQLTVFADSVQPVFDAGLVDLVAVNHRLCEEVSLVPTVGHTPGHVSVHIASRGESALITGDFVHHPCQLARPEWAAVVDFDRRQSTETRLAVLSQLADTSTLMIGTHFAGVSAGHVMRDGAAFRLAT